MTGYKAPRQMSVQELCERFEKDIYFRMHRFEYDRSEARKELVRRGPDVIRDIVKHLIKHSDMRTDGSPMADNVVEAWAALLRSFNQASAFAAA